jgi:hypothetical protein
MKYKCFIAGYQKPAKLVKDSGSAYEERPINNLTIFIIFPVYAYMYDPTLLSQAAEKQTENWPASFRVLGGTGLPVQKYF